MNASARTEMEAESGSSVHFSLGVNERLVTNYDASDASKRPTARAAHAAAAPDEQSVPTPRRRPFLTPLPRRQKSPGAGVPDQTVTSFDSNVTSRGGHPGRPNGRLPNANVAGDDGDDGGSESVGDLATACGDGRSNRP
jgi:hypothetical protein